MPANIAKLVLLVSVLCWGFYSCQSTGNTKKKTEEVEIVDSCRSNPQHTYSVFIPAIEKNCTNLPLLVVIDSHGDGKLAVSEFKDAATKYPAVVVGSNLIRNNDATYIKELEELIADVKSRYPVGKTIFMEGFSGGARMSIGYAATHQVNGVIACGALAQPEQIKTLPCPLMAIIGMDDFNFIEAAPFIINPSQSPSNLSIEITEASHSWPKKTVLTQAFGYFQLSASNSENCMAHERLIKAYVKEQQLRIVSMNTAREQLQAVLIAKNLSRSPVFEREVAFSSISEKLMKNESFALQQNELMKSIRFELGAREAYYNAMLQKDSTWWHKEINTLNSKIESEPDIYTQMAYRRIKRFLGIMCYSLSTQYIRNSDVSHLEQILAIYRMTEPNNADMINFSEVLKQLKGTK